MGDHILFTIRCTTCSVLLQVRSEAAIGQLLICPKCGCLVKVEPPPGWQPRPGDSQAAENAETPREAAGAPSPGTSASPEQSPAKASGKSPRVAAAGKTPPQSRPTAAPPAGVVAGTTLRAQSPPGVRAVDQQSAPAAPGKQPEAPAARPPTAGSEKSSPPVGPIPSAQAYPPSSPAGFVDDQPPLAIQPARMAAGPPEGRGEAVPVGDTELVAPGRFARLIPWIVILGTGGLVGILGVALWLALSPRQLGPAPPGISATGPAISSTTAGEASTAQTPSPETTPPWWRDMLPRQTRLFVYGDFRVLPARQIFPIMGQFGGEAWQEGAALALDALRLRPEALAELLWARSRFEREHPGLIAISLLPQHTTQALSLRGEESDLELLGSKFRTDPTQRWAHPFGVLDSQRVLTGERALLEDVGRRQGATVAFESEIFARLWTQIPSDAAAAFAVDVAALRAAGWEAPAWLFDVWPQVAPAWQVICRIPVGIVAFYRNRPGPLYQIGLLCPSATAADQLAEAVASVVKFAEQLSQQLAEGQVPPGVAEGQETPALPQKEVAFWLAALASLRGLKWEVVDEFLWLRLGVAEGLSAAGSLEEWQEVVHKQWLAAGLVVDRSRHEGLQRALGQYRGQHGSFPPGAGGAALLPPETRLSWIALLLPQLGLEDWHRELNFAYSWNSAQNRTVTQRELVAVINPSLGGRRWAEQFPVTHYVGVGGVGPDAPALPASDPRAGVFGYHRTLRLEDIPDGASNTAAIFGVYDRLGPWAAGGPSTIRPLTQRPYINGPDGFGSGQPHGMLVGMADGSVRFVSAEIDPVVLEQLVAISDGAPRSVEVLAGPLPPSQQQPGVLTRPAVGGELASSPTTDAPGVIPSASGGPAPGGTSPIAEHPGQITPGGNPPAETAQSSPPAAAELVALRLASPVEEVQAAQVALVDAIRGISRLANVPVTFDLDAMIALGVNPRMPLQVTTAAGTFETAISELARQCGLAVVIDAGQLIVTAPPESRAKLELRRYDVADLLTPDTTAEKLAELVTTFVLPESWKHNGGTATLRVDAGGLEVEQTELGHKMVERFLTQLRAVRQRKTESGKPMAPSAVPRATLTRRVTANFFQEVPLSRILSEWERQTGVKLLVNWRALSESGLVGEPRTTIVVNNEPIARALDQLLLPLGLSFRVVENDVIEIATRRFFNTILQVQFYPVGDLLQALAKELGSADAAEDVLLEAISGEVAGQTWADAGGPARMYVDKASQHLIVLQLQPVHAELEELLARLRSEWLAAPR